MELTMADVVRIAVLLSVGLFVSRDRLAAAEAADWPTHLQNFSRNAYVPAEVDPSTFRLTWEHREKNRPYTAWHGPAKWDAYANLRGLHSMRNYDPVFHVAAAGNAVYFGSSADDTVSCIDASTGERRWTFFTEGPVRIAPTIVGERVYFGSDDGYAYCLAAETGKLVWKFRPIDPERLVLNNGRLIPFWPVRTGVAVVGDTAYFAASLLPWKETYLCAVDAATGQPTGPGRYVQKLKDLTLEGPLAGSQRLLIAPQGRVPPMLFARETGKPVGTLDGGGGSFVVLASDSDIIHGPGNKTGWMTRSSASTRERIATHKNARAVVVVGPITYMITDSAVVALDYRNKRPLWRAPCDDPLSLIAVGDKLFIGGVDQVQAFSAKDGQPLWQQTVSGRAYGLAFSQERLLVSTDVGALYSFGQAAKSAETIGEPDPSRGGRPATDATPPDLLPVAKVDDPHLLDRWVLQSPHISALEALNLAQGRAALIDGKLNLVNVGRLQALELRDGATSLLVSEELKSVTLPKKEITVTAWVRVDEPRSWGGIVGALQDNGDDEHGWLLGYRDSKFAFGVAGMEGEPQLTFATAAKDFQLGGWHHVAGVYDGQRIRLFVDGQAAAESDAQQGDIDYPERAFYELAAYHDDDEYDSLTGMLHEVRVYDRALSDQEIADQYSEKAGEFPEASPPATTPPPYLVELGPWLQFTRPGAAIVRWRTAQPSSTRLELRLDDQRQEFVDVEPKTEHEIVLAGLQHNRQYYYTLSVDARGERRITPEYECDTFFDYTLSEGLSDKQSPSPQAAEVLKRADVDRGLCVVVGLEDGRLLESLVRRSQLRVIGFDEDQKLIDRVRRQLWQHGLYGSRIAVHHVADLDRLPITPHCATLVTSETSLQTSKLPCSLTEIKRLLAPTGRAALKDERTGEDGGWLLVSGGSFAGAGEWSHAYGRADNSAYGGEALADVQSTEELEVQWIGQPGPRYQADRNGRKPPPLSTGGRMFLQGLHRILVVDIYNGAVLWSLETPHLERFNMPHDSSNWCADERFLYAAMRDRCWIIDARNGKVLDMPRVVTQGLATDGTKYDWGYVASAGPLLVGSAVRHGAMWADFWGNAGWYDQTEGMETAKVASDGLFAIDKSTRQLRWRYADGPIINSTITIGDGHVCFVECRHSAVREASTRRLGMPEMWRDQYLVALDVDTGKKIWEQPIDPVDGKVVFYMAFGGDRLALVSSADLSYHVYGFESATGKPVWEVTFPWGKGKADHGTHISRPAIVGNRLIVRPAVLDVATGKRLPEEMPISGCGTYACTTSALFFRAWSGQEFAVWSPSSDQYTRWPRLRPDCWLSSIPAGGMLLSPEGGGGCSCGKWMETSIVFIPKAYLERNPVKAGG